MDGVYQLVRTAQLQETEGLPMRKKGRKKKAAEKAAQERGLCFINLCFFLFVKAHNK